MKIRLTLIVVVFFALAIGAMRTAYAAPPKDACSLLTPAQVSSVLGIQAKPGHPDPADTTVCDWPLASLSKMASRDAKEIEVKMLDAGSWAMIAPAATAAPQAKGIGDIAAYLGPSSLVTLYVKKGNSKFLFVNVRGFPVDQVKTKEKTLALDVLAKL